MPMLNWTHRLVWDEGEWIEVAAAGWLPSWAFPCQTHITKIPLSSAWPSWPHVKTTQEPGARVHGLLPCRPSLYSPSVLLENLMVFSELTAALSVTSWLRQGKITPNVRAFVEYGESSGICLLCRSKTSKFLNTDSLWGAVLNCGLCVECSF